MTIEIVGGGLAGLVAAIECAEAAQPVHLREASAVLGGRARTSTGEFKANLGPHVLYDDGVTWAWLDRRGLAEPANEAPRHGLWFRWRGRCRRTPPLGVARALVTHRRDAAPVDVDFRSWLRGRVGDETSEALARAAGVFSFDADPGRLSAAFVWERLVRATSWPPVARYVPGGWVTLIDRLVMRARELGVVIHTSACVDAIPDEPTILAVPRRVAAELLGDGDLARSETNRVVLLDVGLQRRRSWPFAVWDLDEGGWAERFSVPDPTLAPDGCELVQVQLGLHPGESLLDGVARAERLLDDGFAGWRTCEVWRRRSVLDGQTGALDGPGTTWRDRPAIDRGDGVFLVGDEVAAPGLLGEVSVASAVEGARLAVAAATGSAAVA